MTTGNGKRTKDLVELRTPKAIAIDKLEIFKVKLVFILFETQFKGFSRLEKIQQQKLSPVGNRNILPDAVFPMPSKKVSFGFFYKAIAPWLLLGTFASNAVAASPDSVLGIVKSGENTTQWPGITRRLLSSGVPYCVIDIKQIKSAADLSRTQVLFLPNVETLTKVQVTALKEWIEKGGRAIVSGPLGSLSQPNVRLELRSLFGAYWGFALSNSSTIKPLRAKNTNWLQPRLFGNIQGGVIIPAGLDSQTAAVWTATENSSPPAVVTTERSVFLGWRWGTDTVAPADLDSLWLRAALNRYGFLRKGMVETPAATVQTDVQEYSCRSGLATRAGAVRITRRPDAASPNSSRQSKPFNPNNSLSQRQEVFEQNTRNLIGSPTTNPNVSKTPFSPETISGLSDRTIQIPDLIPGSPTPDATEITATFSPSSPINLPLPSFPQGTIDDETLPPTEVPVRPEFAPIPVDKVASMRQELENLIGRFESALLTANAAFESKSTGQQRQNPAIASANKQPIASRTSAEKIVAEAKTGLQTFLQLVSEKNYRGARDRWLESRRILWENYPTDRPIAQPEIRAVWLDRGTIVKNKSEQDLAKVFDSLAAAGINTVFLETVNAGYPIYPSRIAPVQNPMIRGWNPLASAVKLAHERGIELHAWVWIFAAGNPAHNALLNLPKEFPGPVISARPEWANYDNQRQMFEQRSGKMFLDPANPEVRNYLLSILSEIATNYKVDGIHLDYIRYPFQDPNANNIFGYGKVARESFQAANGIDPITITPAQSELWQKWTEFRIAQIDSFVASVSETLRAKRPELIISTAVFPMKTGDRLQRLQQNWELWAQRGDIDMVVPMTYAMDTNGLQQLAKPWLIQGELGATMILPGIRLLNLPDIVAIDQIQLLRDLPAGGYSLFAVQDINDRLQTVFTNTQGTLPKKSGITTLNNQPIPYRQPFRAAASLYVALQREWNFMLTNKQIQIEPPLMKEWNNKAEDLAQKLTQLANTPSTKNLLLARISLTSFRSKFPKWMEMSATNRPYQVQVWDNRLATVERFLRYGERVVINRKVPSVAENK